MKPEDRVLSYAYALMRGSAPGFPAWNIERARQGAGAAWNYVDGCMLSALWRLGEETGDASFFRFAEAYVDPLIASDGTIEGYREDEYNLDNLCEGRVLFPLYEETGKEKYRLAIEQLHGQLLRQMRTPSGNFWHKAIYPNQVWLDGVYMAQVFAAQYERAFGKGDYSDILSQLRTVRAHMYDEKKRLYHHGWDESRAVFWADPETGLSKSFWLRAIGWYAAALAELAVLLPKDEGGLEAGALLCELCEGILPYRDRESAMYFQVVDQGTREGNYLETSGSALVAYAMAQGAACGALDESWAVRARETYSGIVQRALRFDGDAPRLGGVCLSAGLGPEGNRRRDGSFAYYISEPVVENDAKGASPLLLLHAALSRLAKERAV